jgi:outer membrane protein assembly factor BamB
MAGSPVVGDNRIVVGDGDFTLQAFNATGRPVWSRELDGRVVASPVMTEDTVVVGGGSTLYALETGSGDTGWSVDLDDRVTRVAAMASGYVLVGTDGGHLYALGASDADFGEWTATASPSESQRRPTRQRPRRPIRRRTVRRQRTPRRRPRPDHRLTR